MGENGGKMRKCTSGALAALGGFASGVFGALGGIVLNRITAKVKTVICEQAPDHGSYFAYARLCFRKLSIYLII